VERELGRRLLPDAAGVDLKHPEVTVHVEVQPDTAYFYEDLVSGHGGLPVGAEGRAVSLVSGGFDSAVASWLLLKRGVRLDYLFLNLGGDAHRRGVHRVMKVIADQWSYGYRPRLFEIDFAPVVAALKARTTPRYWQVLLKRAMIAAGIDLARYLRAPGLVTGEAVGQVSSQTLQNLAVIGAGNDFPILRPLLGFNKEEIIELSRTIGTCTFSSEVEEYCAILPRHPSTHAALKPVLAEEARLDRQFLLDRFRDRTVIDLRSLELSAPPGLEVETIPEDATVLDLRSAAAFRAWHYPDAMQVDFFEGLRVYGSFDRKPTYVLYCEVGQKSAHLAEMMARDGFRAFHVKHGVRNLLHRVPDRDLLGL
jgi:thiamine biosynthesis protein ThiI